MKKRIFAEVETIELRGDDGPVESLRVGCPNCGESIDVHGTGSGSARLGAAKLRDACVCNGSKYFDLSEWMADEPLRLPVLQKLDMSQGMEELFGDPAYKGFVLQDKKRLPARFFARVSGPLTSRLLRG
jgi:hypothetical protein